MMKHTTRGIAAAGATTGLALALIGIAPLAAQAADSDVAPTVGSAYDEQAQSLLDDKAVQAVGVDDAGNVVVYTSQEKSVSLETQAFIEASDNVVVTEVKGIFTPAATTDVVGGAGYGYPINATSVGLCSVGFSAWTPDGEPGFVSAGHCTDDGAAETVYLTKPSSDTAGGGTEGVEFVAELGQLEFSQFGGPGNSAGADKSLKSIDFAAFSISNPDLTTLPQVTNWSTAASEDLSESVEVITSVGTAKIGPVERSGRTTGKTSGDVLQTNVWFRVGTTDADARFVHGFVTDAHAIQGDSGGPVWQGQTAVGVVSAVGESADGTPLMLAADLQDGLKESGGYTLQLFISKPTVATTGTVNSGSAITGTAPKGTTVVITPSTGKAIEVKTDDAGNWSFPAPATFGDYTFTVQAKNGYNVSKEATGAVNIVPAAPAITTPANGSKVVDEVTEIRGSGIPGATVVLTGDFDAASGLARAAADIEVRVNSGGTWAAPVSLSYGAHRVSAVQVADGVTSAATATAFTVVPAAPVITSPTNGSTFVDDKLPTEITGTGTDGATVTVTVGGVELGTATVEDGTWKLAFPTDLALGAHTLVATQTIDAQTSAAGQVAITITSAAVTPSEEPTSSPVPTTPDADGKLADTGATDSTPGVLGGLALLIAGAALVISRRLSIARR